MLAGGMDVFETARIEAIAGGDAKKIEAFAKVMDSLVRAGKELMNVHKDMFGLQPQVKEEAPKQQAENINNIIFSGNAADLFKLLKDKGVKNLPEEDA